ncbi:MAG TPA: hypothetical protein VGU20_25625 [Stellaceae bacterium]|nr:hypothetical protein [Stellaceae bacterium]
MSLADLFKPKSDEERERELAQQINAVLSAPGPQDTNKLTRLREPYSPRFHPNSARSASCRPRRKPTYSAGASSRPGRTAFSMTAQRRSPLRSLSAPT